MYQGFVSSTEFIHKRGRPRLISSCLTAKLFNSVTEEAEFPTNQSVHIEER